MLNKCLTIAALVLFAIVAHAEPAKQNLYQQLKATGQHAKLIKLFEQAKLDTLLRADTNHTLFAPSDDAFSSVDEKVLNHIVSNEYRLQQLLKNHLVEGTIGVAMLQEKKSLRSLVGRPHRIGKEILTVGGAEVLESNIAASNGMIHVIDRVIMRKAGGRR